MAGACPYQWQATPPSAWAANVPTQRGSGAHQQSLQGLKTEAAGAPGRGLTAESLSAATLPQETTDART